MGVLSLSFYRGCFSPFLEGQWRNFPFLSNEGGRSLNVFFLFPIGGALFDLFFIKEGAQFACFSPSLKRGNFFSQKGAHCPCYFSTLQRGA